MNDEEFAAYARSNWHIVADWIDDAVSRIRWKGSCFLDIAPGDGTRYRISIVRHQHCSVIPAGDPHPTDYMVAILPGHGVGILPGDPTIGPLHLDYVTKTLWRPHDPPDRWTPLLVTDVFNLIFFGRSM